jgi:hypothetical protein
MRTNRWTIAIVFPLRKEREGEREREREREREIDQTPPTHTHTHKKRGGGQQIRVIRGLFSTVARPSVGSGVVALSDTGHTLVATGYAASPALRQEQQADSEE